MILIHKGKSPKKGIYAGFFIPCFNFLLFPLKSGVGLVLWYQHPEWNIVPKQGEDQAKGKGWSGINSDGKRFSYKFSLKDLDIWEDKSDMKNTTLPDLPTKLVSRFDVILCHVMLRISCLDIQLQRQPFVSKGLKSLKRKQIESLVCWSKNGQKSVKYMLFPSEQRK